MSGVFLSALSVCRPVPAFHAGDRGSNPLGDATKIAKGYAEKCSPFLVLGTDIGPTQGPTLI
jgi:hypothetical protein